MITRLSKVSLIGIIFIFTLCSSLFAQCPPDYPIDCGDGCCSLDYPVCGRGINRDSCFEAGVNPYCPSLTIYGEQSAETQLLRYFRDNVLSQSHEGRELIKLYYQWSPVIVRAMEADDEFKEEVKEMIDGVLPLLGE